MNIIIKPRVAITTQIPVIVASLIALLLSACTGNNIVMQHPSIQDGSQNTPTATVYFIRPSMLKRKGPSDAALSISLNKEKILEINEGSYALISLKPGKAVVATHSKTKFTNQLKPIKVSRHREYNFLAGKTYFIHIARVDEEFRGIFFDPKPVNLLAAKKLLPVSSPFGTARYSPIEYVQIDDDSEPLAGDMPPAFPESLYPGQKYILKDSPFK